MADGITETQPRRWPVGSPEPQEVGLRVQSVTNHIIFRLTAPAHWGRWLAEQASGGDGNEYSWHAINSEHADEGGMEVVEVLDAPATPKLAADGITDEMITAAAKRMREYMSLLADLGGETQWADLAKMALTAGLAGRAVVDLPEPTAWRNRLDGDVDIWPVGGWSVTASPDGVGISTSRDGLGGGIADPATATQEYAPAPGDFKLSVVEMEKKCFGSAGCLITFRVEVTYLGLILPDPSKTFTAIYDVTGGDEPQTNRFTITGSQVSVPSEEMIQTGGPNAVLTATVTRTM